MKRVGFVYILTNKSKTVLYVGVTNNISRRVAEHKNKINFGFTYKYNVTYLVYYERSDSIVAAIAREKYLKGKSRQYKVDLINDQNPDWKDLYLTL